MKLLDFLLNFVLIPLAIRRAGVQILEHTSKSMSHRHRFQNVPQIIQFFHDLKKMYRLCSNFSFVILDLTVTVGTSKKLAAMLLCKFEEKFMKVIMTSPDTAEKFRHLLRLNIQKAKQMSSNENFNLLAI